MNVNEYTPWRLLSASSATGAIYLDAEGASATHLREILDTWDSSRRAKPRVLYVIPSGQNPTGATQSPERRQEIYQISEENDLTILEDDPYYFLRPGECSEKAGTSVSTGGVPSYLSVDTSGRVVRLDSASKILAPGLRAGWVTANASIIDKFVAYHEISTVAVSGPVLLMLWKLLDESWGHKGFFSWLDQISQQYRLRRDLLLELTISISPRYLYLGTARLRDVPLDQMGLEKTSSIPKSDIM